MAKKIKDIDEKKSTWLNDNDVPARFELCDKVGDMVEFVMQPGDTKILPAYFDNAIRQLDKNRTVVGGQCPWLKKLDASGQPEDLEMDKSLDYKKAIEDTELLDLAALIEKKEKLAKAAEMQQAQKARKPRKGE